MRTRFSTILAAALLAAAGAPGCGGKKGDGGAAAAIPGGDSAPGAVAKKPGDPARGQDKPKPGAARRTRSRGDEHAVFSLIDNRLLAHVQRGGGLVALPGSAGFAKYMRFGKQPSWKIRQEREGQRVGVADRYASVEVPLGAGQSSAAGVWVRLYNPAARRMTVKLNGRDLGTVELAAGWSTAHVAVPAGAAAAPGENTVQLVTSPGANIEVAWIQLGGAEPPASGEAPRWYDREAGSLLLPSGGGVAYYVMVPEQGKLAGVVDGDGCAAKVSAQPQRGQAVEGRLEGDGVVDLSKLAGQVVRLELTGDGCAEARLADASLVVPGPAPTFDRDGKPRPKYVVLWIMDSLRSDRVRAFNPKARPESPVFDDLVGRAAMFQQTYVQGNESRASHASIWSSLYVARHRMISETAKLDTKWFTVDELMKKAGMYASGVSGNGYIIARRGFGDAWDAFKNHIHEGGGVRGEDILADAIKSIDGKKDPWFLYIGTIDTHVSWRAKRPWIDKYDPGYQGRYKTEVSGGDVGKMAAGAIKPTDAEKTHIIAIYDSNVSYQDDLLGQLLRKLAEWGIADQTMVVVTGDHGDEQWEVGRVGHGGSLRESLVHVPLAILYPPLLPAGKVAEGVEAIDIVPTLADALGVKADPEWQGESLIGLVNGIGRGYPRLSMASQYETAHAGRLGPWKLRIAGIAAPQVYNLVEDPGEKNDVADSQPLGRRFVADPLWTLRMYNEEWRKAKWGNAANVTAQMAADLGE